MHTASLNVDLAVFTPFPVLDADKGDDLFRAEPSPGMGRQTALLFLSFLFASKA
jgi:hypothetical protein